MIGLGFDFDIPLDLFMFLRVKRQLSQFPYGCVTTFLDAILSVFHQQVYCALLLSSTRLIDPPDASFTKIKVGHLALLFDASPLLFTSSKLPLLFLSLLDSLPLFALVMV